MNEGPVYIVHLEEPPGFTACTGEPYARYARNLGPSVMCTGCGVVGDRLMEARARLARVEREHRQIVATLITAAGGEIKVARRVIAAVDVEPLVLVSEDFLGDVLTYRVRSRITPLYHGPERFVPPVSGTILPPTKPDPERT